MISGFGPAESEESDHEPSWVTGHRHNQDSVQGGVTPVGCISSLRCNPDEYYSSIYRMGPPRWLNCLISGLTMVYGRYNYS